MSHRARVAVAGAVAAAVVAVAMSTAAWSPGRGGAAGELADLLRRSRPASQFAFDHRGGTRVLDCFLPNRAVTGIVDVDTDMAEFTGPDGQVLARRTRRQALVHRRALVAGAISSEWLAVELPASDEQQAALVRALGADLAGYLLADGLPADGTATARAALDAAAEVERLGTDAAAGPAATGYRITLDDDFAAGSAPATATGAGRPAVMPPLIELWVHDDGAVVRVAVQPTRPDGSTSEPEDGWTLDFGPGRSLPPENPDNVTPIGQVEVGTLRGPSGVAACDVPL